MLHLSLFPPLRPLPRFLRSSQFSVSSQSYEPNVNVREPRRQVALPDSPPLTPPQFKDQFGPTTHTSFSAIHGTPPPTTSDASESTLASLKYDHGLLGPNDIPRQHGVSGLGLAFSQQGAQHALSSSKVSSAYEAKQSQHPMSLSNSYKGVSHAISSGSLSRTLAALPRVPRRIRPALLLATSLLAVILIWVSRSVGSGNLDPLVKHHADSGPFGRRMIATSENRLYDINDERVDEEEVLFNPRPPVPAPSSDPIQFASKKDELLTLIGFITAATGNILPAYVDPSESIDMSVLVGFDPSAAGAADDLEFLKEEVITQHPLVLFGRMRDPWHHEVVSVLDQWKITPSPLIVEVDQRRDAATFEPVLERLFGTDELPQLVLAGQTIGGAQEVLGMETDDLKDKLEKSGLMTVAEKKKKKNDLAAQRERQHRLLHPDPIED